MNKSFHAKLFAVVIALLLLLAAVTGGYAHYLQCHAISPPLWMCLYINYRNMYGFSFL